METVTEALPSLHVDDELVQNAARDAVSAACASLDQHFPGGDRNGISSNFAGLLEQVILQMLTGVEPSRRAVSTYLPTLVLDDHHFGDPLMPGSLFVVTKTDGIEYTGKTVLSGDLERIPRVLVLNDTGSAFVSLRNTESVNPYLKFSSAVQDAVMWLRRNGSTQAEEKLQIRAIKQVDSGYTFC